MSKIFPPSLRRIESTIVRCRDGQYKVLWHGLTRRERFDSLSEASRFIDRLDANYYAD